MGVVYVAEDVRLGRRVAIKFPLAGTDEKSYRARFLREARAVSSISHRNIAAVYDYGETEDGQPYIVMELVTGQTLGEILAGTGVSIAQAVEIVADVAEALAAAHRRGVVHRDIKPSNVIVNERGEVKVLDFGLAKQFGEENGNANGDGAVSHLKTRSDVIIGTPLYLSPEQARGGKIDGRSDLFTLGALLYECVAGRPAFSGANVIEIGAQVLHVDPAPPSKYNPRVPAELDRVVMKALSKQPEDRYQKAEDIIVDLDRARLKLPATDTVRTRRLTTQSQAMRASALMTISEGLRRPRVSPLTFLLALLAVPLLYLGYHYATRPAPHVPTDEVRRLYEKGVEEMRAGAFHRASGPLERAVALDPKFILARARLAEAWMELEYFDRSREELIAVSELDRSTLPEIDGLYVSAVTATARREFAQAAQAYDKIAELDPRPETHYDAGRAHDKNNAAEKAIAAFVRATEANKNYAPAFLRLGVIYARQNNNPAAVDAFDNAEKLFREQGNLEGRGEVHYQRGFYHYTRGRMPEARAQLEQALALATEVGNQAQRIRALLQLGAVLVALNDSERAEQLAREALEAAQAHGMETLTARALVEVGVVYMTAGKKFKEAEDYFRRGLDFARRSKARRVEAMAHFNLANLFALVKRNDEAIEHADRALLFYREAGFRKEESLLLIILTRAKRNKGDFEGALGALREQLELAGKLGDQSQAAVVHGDIASVLILQEKYTDALEHLGQKFRINKSLGQTSGMAYALAERGGVLAQLGRYEEARAELDQAMELLNKSGGEGQNKPGGGSQRLVVYIHVLRAEMALSRRDWAEAVAQARLAIELAGAEHEESVTDAKRVLGLAQVSSGARREGLREINEAAQKAAKINDEQLTNKTALALARAKLETGDARGALSHALGAQESFTRRGQAASLWWAWAVASQAAAGIGDGAKAREYAAGAASALSRMREMWGEEAYKIYLDRPDVQYYYDRLGATK
jgi:tetratricopeptide (TPR) repeat protein